MSKHIIEITKENEQRHLERRTTDTPMRIKAEMFDQIITDCKFQHEFFMKLWRAMPEDVRNLSTGSFYEGQIAAFKKILAYAGYLSERESCEKIGRES